jgi:hypothetical protein
MDEIRLYAESMESTTVQDMIFRCTPWYLDVFRLWWHLCQEFNLDTRVSSIVRSPSDWLGFLYPDIPSIVDHLNAHLINLYQVIPIR